MQPDLPEVGRRGSVAGFRAALRFLRTDGGYHAAALTYYLILALFPGGALIYALLGIFGAESAIDDAAEELDERCSGSSAPSRRLMTRRRSSTSADSTPST